MNDPLIYKIKRLWNGLASVRDYTVQKAIKEGKPLRLELVGSEEFVEFSPEDLQTKKFQISSRKFVSRFDGNNYELIDFSWKTNKRLATSLIQIPLI